MEYNEQNNFETVAANAEEKLGRVSCAMEEAMKAVPSEMLERTKRALIETTADDFLSSFLDHIKDWNFRRHGETIVSEMKTTFSDIASKLPPEYCEAFMKKVFKNAKWELCYQKSSGNTFLALPVFLSLLVDCYAENETEQKKNNQDTSPVSPLALRFDSDDFSRSPYYLGALLPEHAILTVDGDVGRELGCALDGGRITVLGNAGIRVGDEMEKGVIEITRSASDWLGVSMTGGTIEVLGSAGRMAGLKMEGGTLNIHGEVRTFYQSAFKPENHGTIIWHGVTIWNDGWTTEGKEMKNRGEIPVE